MYLECFVCTTITHDFSRAQSPCLPRMSAYHPYRLWSLLYETLEVDSRLWIGYTSLG